MIIDKTNIQDKSYQKEILGVRSHLESALELMKLAHARPTLDKVHINHDDLRVIKGLCSQINDLRQDIKKDDING